VDYRVIVLTRPEVAALLSVDDCTAAVERGFLAQARGQIFPAGVLGTHVHAGGFHVKTAGLDLERPLFAAKVNANFPGNPSRYALPTIQGVVALFDAENGRVLALLDSIALTSLRTAAASAVAARYLARTDASVVAIVGCGEQGRSQLRALVRVRPITTALAFDIDGARAAQYAREMAAELGIAVQAVAEMHVATRMCDICVTCTPSRRPLLDVGDVRPGTFVAAVGADNPEKQEIAPALLAACTLVVDVLEQCATIGDLHHAIAAGVVAREDVHAELSAVIGGTKPGRRSDDEIIVFDSTGTALEDVAAAAVVYAKAVASGRGMRVDLGGA
jgi:alanine dehydrogenase